MVSHFFDRSRSIVGIAVIVLLTCQSCRQAKQQPRRSLEERNTTRQRLDSLLPACKAIFKAVHEDTSRTDLLKQGFQLMAQAEKLAEQEQYLLDYLGIVAENGAFASLLTGDSATGRDRMVYAKNIYRRTGNWKALVKAHLFSTRFYNADNGLATKIAILDTAARITLENRDTLQYLSAVEKRAAAYKEIGQKEAYRRILEDMLVYTKKHFPVKVSETAYYLARHYEVEGQTARALRYRLMSVDHLVNDTAHQIHHADYYQTLGYLYFDMGKRTAAKQYFEKALEQAVIPGRENSSKAVNAITWVVACYTAERRFKEGLEYTKKALVRYPPATYEGKVIFAQNLLELYMLNSQYAKARQYAAELMDYDQQRVMPDIHRQFSYELIGRLYSKTNDPDNARVYLLKALELAKKTDDLTSMVEDSRQLFIVDSMAGRYLDAIRRFQDYKNFLDSKRVKMQARELREMDIKYETEKKTAAVKSLTEKTLLQQSLIQQASFVKNLFVAIAVLLLLVLVILFSRYRLKQRVNKQLEENQEKINQQNLALEKLIADERILLAEKTDLLTEKTQLLVEKDWLLKEVHHRVKNNLQIMMSLLESQAMYLQHDALRALEDSQRRIFAMSLIHQKLYLSEDIRILNMERYMREFVYYLEESFDASNRIVFTFDVAPVELSVTQAMPLALIVNEAVTNSIKYAFPHDARGEISISLAEENGEIEMELADNGVGLPPDVLQGNRTSLGMELIKGLCAQIKGNICFKSPGTRIVLRFKRAIFEEMVYPVLLTEQVLSKSP